MPSLSQINIKFNADLKQFSSQMQNAQRKLKRFGGQLKRVGTGLTIGLTAPIVALGIKSVISFDKQAKAIAQVEAGLKSTGSQVGFTSEALQKMARDLQDTSLFGDEDILTNATAQLLTFTNIAGKQFKRTTLAVLDLSTRLGVDLKSSAIQLGKALNDPVANLSALSRSGIQFSKDQKEVINAFVKTNRLAEAQTLILDELEKQYGGSAAAAAAAGLGPFKQLGNAIGDLIEDFGEIITEALIPFIKKVQGVVKKMRDLSDGTKKIIVVAGVLLAALGPVLIALGGFITLLPAITAGFAAMTGPIGLVVVGIAGLVYVIASNWDAILDYLKQTREYFQGLYDDVELVRVSVNLLSFVLQDLWRIFKSTFGKVLEVFGIAVKNFFDQLKHIGAIAKAALQGDFKAIFKASLEGGKAMQKSFDKIKDVLFGKDSGGATSGLGKSIDRIKEAIVDLIPPVKKAGDGLGVLNAKVSKVDAGIGKAASGYKVLGDVMEATGDQMAKFIVSFDEAAVRAAWVARQINEGVTELIKDAVFNLAAGFADILAGFATGTAGFADVGSLLLKTLGELLKNLGEVMIEAGIALIALKLAFKSFGGLGAIAAGIAVRAFGQLIASRVSKLPGQVALAGGGLAFGETLALVGDNRNARFDPEVIAPLSKIREFIGSQAGGASVDVQIEGLLRGSDLELVVSRVIEKRLRRA